MAGDWIKMRTDLWTDPRVVKIASTLRKTQLAHQASAAVKAAVVGGLYRLWSIADTHTTNGKLTGYDVQALDEDIGIEGFSEAVTSVGWLKLADGQLLVPRFKEHSGHSAKRRAQETVRKQVDRSRPCPPSVRKMSASHADKMRTREEKRREEKNKKNPPTPQEEKPGEEDRITASDRQVHKGDFETFWVAIPVRHRQSKVACREEFIRARRRGADPELLAARVREYYESHQGRGEFANQPKSWLAGGKYDDPPESWKSSDIKAAKARNERLIVGEAQS